MTVAVPVSPVVSPRKAQQAVCMIIFMLCLAAYASADCAGPATPGIRVCYPSPNSTVTYPATLEIGSSLGSATVAAVKVYDNNKQIDNLGFLPSALTDGGVYNGTHHIVINAWDTTGRLYQASATFNVVGFGYGSCKSTAVGVNVCSPTDGQVMPNLSVPITMKANGANGAKVTSWKMYIDNKQVMSSQPDFANYVNTGIPVTAGNHHLVINAWDSNGKLYQTARNFTAFYEHDCNPRSGVCTPGIVINAPYNVGPYGAQDVPSNFTFQADVVQNPTPTTKMQLALDGKIVTSNSGPGITADMHPTPGSHILSVTAWDTQGKMYATYATVNVQ